MRMAGIQSPGFISKHEAHSNTDIASALAKSLVGENTLLQRIDVCEGGLADPGRRDQKPDQTFRFCLPLSLLRKLGGRTRARTWDPMIKSHLLYQLSYAPGTCPEIPRGTGSFSKANPRCPAMVGRFSPAHTTFTSREKAAEIQRLFRVLAGLPRAQSRPESWSSCWSPEWSRSP